MASSNTTESTVNNNVNYKDGYHFDFEHDGIQIHVFGSALSGKEVITINGNEVSNKRNFFAKSCHQFLVDGQQLEIEYRMISILRGEVHCTLISDDVHIATQKKALLKRYQMPLKTLSFWVPVGFVIGLLVGFSSYYYLFKG